MSRDDWISPPKAFAFWDAATYALRAYARHTNALARSVELDNNDREPEADR